MGPKERIERTVMTAVSSVKDLVAAKLVESTRRGDIQLEQPALSQVISLVVATIEAGYRQGESVLDREIQSALDAVRLEATIETAKAATGREIKKKTAGT